MNVGQKADQIKIFSLIGNHFLGHLTFQFNRHGRLPLHSADAQRARLTTARIMPYTPATTANSSRANYQSQNHFQTATGGLCGIRQSAMPCAFTQTGPRRKIRKRNHAGRKQNQLCHVAGQKPNHCTDN